MAETKADADKAFDLFVATYEAKYPKATECLAKDRDVLLDVLRLPGRALDSPADDQPDREHVRHGAPAAPHDQGQRHPHGLPDDGLQADAVRRQAMAAAERLRLSARRHRRSSIHRRNQTPRSRRLKTSYPQLLTISPTSGRNIDIGRLYLTGLSNGGGGTWNMLSRYENQFAAAVPICGVAPALDFAPTHLIHDAIAAFHARDDSIVSVSNTRSVVSRILTAAGVVIAGQSIKAIFKPINRPYEKRGQQSQQGAGDDDYRRDVETL